MKCRKCGGRAVLELRRHNTAFCGPDFQEFFQHHVLETVRRWRMFTRDETVLVAVSGGKDSLALWDVLHGAGYRTTGLYIDLGIFDYSHASKARCQAFAAERGLELRVVAVQDEVGAPIPAVRDVPTPRRGPPSSPSSPTTTTGSPSPKATTITSSSAGATPSCPGPRSSTSTTRAPRPSS